MAWEVKNSHRMKLFTGQDVNCDPSEEEGEERTATLEVRDKKSCCPSEYKYLFGIPVDEEIIKFSTGAGSGSSRSFKIDSTEREQDGYTQKSSQR